MNRREMMVTVSHEPWVYELGEKKWASSSIFTLAE